jgi:nucleoside-diphosphate-sugar epimerase
LQRRWSLVQLHRRSLARPEYKRASCFAEFTIRQFAETVISLTGSSSKIAYRPLPNPRQRCPDIGLAQNLLAWAPRVQLRDGLMKTIEYVERLLRSDPSDERLAILSAQAAG